MDMAPNELEDMLDYFLILGEGFFLNHYSVCTCTEEQGIH